MNNTELLNKQAILLDGIITDVKILIDIERLIYPDKYEERGYPLMFSLLKLKRSCIEDKLNLLRD